MTRRKFVHSGLLLFVGTLVWPGWVLGRAPAKSDQAFSFRWRVPAVHKKEVEQTLRFQGKVDQERDKKGVMVWIFIGLVLLPDLAKPIYDLVQGMKYGGVKIDTRGGKFDVDTDKSFPPGMVAVASDEGTTLYERGELSDFSELVAVLLQAK